MIDVSALPDGEAEAVTPLAVEARRLRVSYGMTTALRGLTMHVPQGSIYGLLGLNGAGKSTTLRALMGLLPREEGDLRVLGYDPAKDDVALKERVGYVADPPLLFDRLDVNQTLRFVATYRPGRWNWDAAERMREAADLINYVPVSELSKGKRVRLALILALAFDPDLLLLDEPTAGLDPLARREFIRGVLGEFQREGKTIVISSHLVDEISGLVDYVGILHMGSMLWQGPVEELLRLVRRVRLTFRDEAPPQLQPLVMGKGLLSYEAQGREALAVVRDMDDHALRSALSDLHLIRIEPDRFSLEDAFVELVGAEERQRKQGRAPWK